MRKKMFFVGPLALVGIIAFMAIGGIIVLQLWNWLLPPLFGFHLITFWQAIGLLLLCRILFGGFGFHRKGHSHFRQRMRERCANMTPEERERFRQRMRDRWGFAPPEGESHNP